MSLKKHFILILFSSLTISAFSQQVEPVFLKWKVKQGESITYKVIMKEIDSAQTKFSINGFPNLPGSDSASSAQFQKILTDLKSANENNDYTAVLKKNKRGFIDIELHVVNNDQNANSTKVDTGMQKFQALMKQISGGVMLRGSIYENGTIESFYTNYSQKNLIAILFELPGKPVKVGDSWPLDVNLVSADQNFICDSAYNKNEVTIARIENKNGDTIVTMKYDIVQYIQGKFDSPFGNSPIPTIMKFGFTGFADFSINKGKWISYNGVMYGNSTGIMTSNSAQKFALIPQ